MKKIIISIGREFGSGGRRIGELLAKELEVPWYDRHLIEEAACCSGFERLFILSVRPIKSEEIIITITLRKSGGTEAATT